MKLVITRAQLEAKEPCSHKYFENSPAWNGEALVYEDLDAEVARLAAIPGATALKWLSRHNLIPHTFLQVRAAIKKAQLDKAEK